MARDFKRTDRIADVIQKELAKIIQREVKDPRIGMITISGVKVSKDLAYAKVFVSVLQEEHAQETLRILNKAASFLRGLLAKRIQIRSMPALSFIYDDVTVKANRLSKLIEDVVAQDKPQKESKKSE